MGQQQSKDELLHQQVVYGNVEGIKALSREGVGLEVLLKLLPLCLVTEMALENDGKSFVLCFKPS